MSLCDSCALTSASVVPPMTIELHDSELFIDDAVSMQGRTSSEC